MSSSNFLPKRTEFFAFLSAHTDRIVAGANAASRLVNGLGNPAGAAETAAITQACVPPGSAGKACRTAAAAATRAGPKKE